MEVQEIKHRLKATGRTQSELAQRLGISKSHMSFLLNGQKRMALDTFREIEAFLAEAERKGAAGVAEARAPFESGGLIRFVTLEEAKAQRRVRMTAEEGECWMRELKELGELGRRLPLVTEMSDDALLGFDETP